MPKPLRPSLRFISTLPTIKLKETILHEDTVIWKVELDKPVDILYGPVDILYMPVNILYWQHYLNLSTFWVEAIALKRFSKEKGWHYDMKIGIKRYLGDYTFIIGLRDEEWYIKNEWWSWSIMPQCFI